jgi:uncharacterized delta-60 repeat protein
MTRYSLMRSSKRIQIVLALTFALTALIYFTPNRGQAASAQKKVPLPPKAPSADGDLDATFGTGGVVSTNFGASHNSRVQALGIQSTGKIIAGGIDQAPINFALTRYTTGGVLDMTFGPGMTGKVITDFNGSTDQMNDLAITSTDKIVAVGSADNPSASCGFNSNSTDIGIAVYTNDGSLDTSFNACGSAPCGGKKTIDFFGCDDRASAVLIQPADQKIVIAGEATQFDSGMGILINYLVLVRLNPDGTFDNTFGTGGKVSIPEAGALGTPTDIALTASGKFIVVGHSTTNDFFVARFTSTGGLDSGAGGFAGGAGVVTTSFSAGNDTANSVVLQADGKIIAAGTANQSGGGGTQDFAMARYNSDGTLDDGGAGDTTPGDSFGTGGKVTTDFSAGTVSRVDTGDFVGLTSTGKIVMVGFSQGNDSSDSSTSTNVSIARYDSMGVLDPSFGTGGKVTNTLGSPSLVNSVGAHGGAIQSDNKILVGGGINNVGQSSVDFFVARFANGLDCTLTCPPNKVQSNDANMCGAIVTYASPTETGTQCSGTITCAPASGTFFPVGITTVSCSDSAGPTCTFTVTVNDTQPPTITCPANQSVPGTTCQNVTYTTPTPSDNCMGATASCSPASGTCFAVGTTTVTCTAKDAAMNMAMCTFTVTVSNCTSITCPPNKVQSNDPNQCGAVVNYPAPTPSGSCGTITCSPASGSFFPKGTTTVTCTSSSGPTCTFTVTVNDTQPPSITCPANITKSNDSNQCGAVVNYPAPTVSDNCPGVGTPTCTPASGSFFPKGTTTVTCSVKDASNNMASCTFTVTVNDTQPPSITCPANVTAVTSQATCPSASCQAVSFPAPTASDNCPGVTVACSPASGSCFPLGTATVTCTATDTSGNTATCSFTVTTFDVCLQDDATPATVLLFNSQTGDYRFCCGGTVFTGRGKVRVQGCTISLEHITTDRRVQATVDKATFRGTASLQTPPGVIRCTISDRDIRNNSCKCP